MDAITINKVPTITTCGHVYCWNCIVHWFIDHSSNSDYSLDLKTKAIQKSSCPVCRYAISISQLRVLRM